MSYQRPGTAQRTSGLSIVSLVLAVLVPVAGLILGIVARVQARRTGAPTAIATVAVVVGAVLSAIWTICIALVVWGGLTLYYTDETSSGEAVEIAVPDSAKSVVLELTAEDDLDAETLAAARAVVEQHATQAGMAVLAVNASDEDSLVVSFDEDTADELIAQFGQSLASPPANGFSQVLAVVPGDGGQVDSIDEMSPSCVDLPFGSARWNELTVVCDDTDETQYLFADGPRVPGSDITEVIVSGDILAVTLSPDAAAEFEEWTGQLAAQADGGRIAIVDANGVLSAPVVQAAIAGGEFQISGGGPDFDAQVTADRLRVLSAGVAFSVAGAKAG
ncbi:SecDF P1 head subdomain-containing protein [Microbacterium sp. NPDC087591]|uniref:SecDF P1 head subdomain-containing protein n=1 Tax=Microbacterium sp. NPDC087591 TaxID=3364192 RepID=UPI0038270D57